MSEALELGIFAEDQVGFRLSRLEIYNWGTFDGQVWTLRMDEGNALLTGQIGSGKSTLVDAITTLLVPRVDYNKAAGAEFRERTLASYVAGHYKTERSPGDLRPRPVALRDTGQYSVLLAVFRNRSLDQTVTLAQVFWHKDQSGSLGRMFVISDADRSIAADFADFGGQIRHLKSRLRTAGDSVHDSFAQYARDYRRRFGIRHAKAMDLFHQTVSMKSVGNLTDFVRSHMLEPTDTEKRLTGLIEHYEDLNRAHDAVVTARKQVESLAPLIADLDQADDVTAQMKLQRTDYDLLRQWFLARRMDLLATRLNRHRARLADRQASLDRAAEKESRARTARADLQQDIRTQGGDRMDRLKHEIDRLISDRDSRRGRADHYQRVCTQVGLEPATEPTSFREQQESLSHLIDTAEQRMAELDEEITEESVAVRDTKVRILEGETELRSLASRDSNIDAPMIELRRRLCDGTGLAAADLPYAGELLRVIDPAWEPAAERVLRGFGLSLLVPAEHYRAVMDWVDRSNLRGRLVYFRVGRSSPAAPIHDERLLSAKIEVRSDSPLRDWLEHQVAQRFDLICATSPEEFRSARRALTVNGQIKHSGERHEKDDRRALGDRRNYVLGWDNAEKRAALESELGSLQATLAHSESRKRELTGQRHELRLRVEMLRTLGALEDFDSLDWRAPAALAAGLTEELHGLEQASDVLAQLTSRLSEVEDELQRLQERSDGIKRDIGRVEQQISDDEQQLANLTAEIGVQSLDPEPDARIAERVESETGGDSLTLSSCERVEQAVRREITAELLRLEKMLRRTETRIVRRMGEFRARWPLVAAEMDVSLESGGEYRSMLDRLVTDDLPRFESDFKRQLNTEAIREVVAYRAALEDARLGIQRRVEIINDSLRDIDYQPHTYIRLEMDQTLDADVRGFLSDLKACADSSVTGADDDHYSEQKFLQVRDLIVRFKGREGRAEEDRRWTAKVTDVRNWFTFAASERLRSDDTEYEHYSDSGGKSGGQKEKLAYTILAASLAYQFGLVSGEVHSRTFRFVVIDEAFGRGSEESARFGLELFDRLQLQLLVVTPLQKIHVIEPYVSSVGFVHNDGGHTSKLRNLTIDAYREERAQHRRAAGAGPTGGDRASEVPLEVSDDAVEIRS